LLAKTYNFAQTLSDLLRRKSKAEGSLMNVLTITDGFDNTEKKTSNILDLEAKLITRHEDGKSIFYLSHEGEEKPMLMISVKHDLAYLYYFPADTVTEYYSEEESAWVYHWPPHAAAGFYSIGNMPDMKPGEMATFPISENRGDDIDVPNEAVVPFSVAVAVAKEFFYDKSLPKAIEWFELGKRRPTSRRR
jgi:hypothetical protein